MNKEWSVSQQGSFLGECKRGEELGYKTKGHFHIWAACVDCGKPRWTETRKKSEYVKYQRCQKCAVKRRRGKNSPHWRGGRCKEGNGYIRVLLRPNDFFYPMASKKGYVLEHRLVMAQHLGRCLASWEWVHHKNGIKDDNKLENLELVTDSSHLTQHTRGYRDGYEKGYREGKINARLK